MNDLSKSVLLRALRNLTKRLDYKITNLQTWDRRFSGIRLAIFISGVGILFLITQKGDAWLFSSVLVLFIIVFILVALSHKRINYYKERFALLKSIKLEDIGRMNLNWDAIPEPNEQQLSGPANHPFSDDFNIVGRHSLMHLIDTAIYPGGTNRLKEWLLKENPDLQQIAIRQALVKELKPIIHFRDKLKINAAETKTHVSEKDWTMDDLLAWLRRPSGKKYRLSLLFLGSLALINIILGILFLIGLLKPYVIFTFVIYLVAYNFNSDKIKGLFDAAFQMEKLLGRFSKLLLYLEKQYFKQNSSLKEFVSLYQEGESKPSRFLKKIVRLSAAASSQKNEVLWFLLNAVVPWDLYFSAKLEQYKSELEPKLSAWLDKFYDLEALCSLSHFAWLNPGYTFELPTVAKNSNAAFQGENLGHPLIPESQKVTNDFSIDEVGNLILLTGSNMAGKSTFLRTIGVNLCLCFAGGPVNATTFKTKPFRLFSSINVKDSLDQGLSHFYAEVKRLRRLLEELQSEHDYPLFFFVDEIYRGTNNRERLTGSTAFLKTVAGKNGIGMVTTHDLELAQLEKEIPVLSNWHFEETIEDGKMSFEYKLKPGPCPTTNALKIMEMEGLPV